MTTDSSSGSDAELCAWALALEDCCWARDLILANEPLGNPAVWIFTPQLMRIAYEVHSLGSRSFLPPHDLVTDDELAVIEAGRLSVKLLDVRNGYQVMADFFASAAVEHDRKFVQPVLEPLRFLARDLGIYGYRDRVVASTQTMLYWSGEPPAAMNDPSIGEIVFEHSAGAGRLIARALSAFEVPAHDVELPVLNLALFDAMNDRYLSCRFGDDVSSTEGSILAAVEASVNCALVLFPDFAGGHPDVVLRIQAITVAHAWSTLTQMAERSPRLRILRPVKQVLSHADLAALMNSPEFKWFRNTCVHYTPKNGFEWDPRASATTQVIRHTLGDRAEEQVRCLIVTALSELSLALAQADYSRCAKRVRD